MLGVSAFCVAVLYIGTATGQPVWCNDGAQCAVGYYCEIDAKICRECLRCEDLKREPAVGLAPNTCIKSVSECGECYKGLVVDRRGNVDAECVPPDTSTEGGDMTAYLWLFIVAGLLFVGLVLGIIVYVLRNSEELFKTPAANQRRITSITASAPESPPPYNQVPYESVPAESPTPFPYTNNYELDEHPFIKRAPPSRPPSSGARESDANQAARVYNAPFYSRENQPPCADQPTVFKVEEDTNISIHDEETTPSAWVPTSDTNDTDDNDNAASGTSTSLSQQLAAARDTTIIEAPPAKKPRLRQDTNNNRNNNNNRESDTCEGVSYPRSPSPTQAGNVITQIINVVQFHNK